MNVAPPVRRDAARLALERVRSLSPRVRLLAVAALAASLVLGVLAAVATRDTRVVLFATPLRPEQLAEVEQRLAAWSVPYVSLADNVRVERARRGDLLLRLALAGVPHPHLAGSDEALAHVGALTPPAVLEAQTRDALAADLALALRGVDGIDDARVVIAPASGGMYADEPRRDASASVRVTLAPGARLGARTVAGIQAFVAGGVPGLDAQRVVVLDDHGFALAADAGDDATDVQAALQSALDAAFGAGATIVRVHREAQGERRELDDVRRSALGGTIARTSDDERYASAQKRYSRSGGSEDRGSETREERRSSAPDATARLSVAIFVDAARGLDVGAIRALAAATVGLRPARGDALQVEAVAFGSPPRLPRAPAPGWLLAFAGLAPQLLTAVAVVAVVAFAARPAAAVVVRAVEAASARHAAREAIGVPPARVRGALAGEPPHVAAAIISALPAATAAAVLELYPPEERAAIVRRLARGHADLVPPVDELIRA
ncbi:MAG TPA: flagellar M-ring protein FliF C-terminal domain-containing protein [Candidatus Sulfotelmatobacter sp.]|nr:flagellar M-ring protein FliF C-terminal domain-containing protein [Candidatus Sulfotelmatobacter sp.]